VSRRAPTRVVRALTAAVLAALVVGASACNLGTPPAATVEGQTISATRVDEIIDAYMEADPEQFGQLEGAGRDTVQLAAASSLLANLVSQVFQSELAAQNDATPTSEERQEAEQLVKESFVSGAETPTDGSQADPEAQETSAAIYEALPSGTQEWLVDLKADTLALARVLAEGEDLTSQAREIYEADPSAFEQLCLRAIIAEPDGVADVRERIAAGEDFGAISAEVSVDPTLAAANGELGQCLTLQQLAQAGLSQDVLGLVAELGSGEATDAIDLGDGFAYFFEVQSRQTPEFEAVVDQITATLPDPGEAAVQALVAEERPDADISVDPRFGEWDGETGVITPPPGATTAETVPADFGAGQPATSEPQG
jgi:hypothetical protein